MQTEAASDQTALATVARLLAAAGQRLTVVPQVDIVKRPLSRGRAILTENFRVLEGPATRASHSGCRRK